MKYDNPNQADLDNRLIRAIETCDLNGIHDALAAHANPNVRFPVQKEYGIATNQTPLHALMDYGQGRPLETIRGAVRLLMKAGADIEAVDDLGNHPIHESVRNETANTNGLIALIESGADVNAQGGSSGYTALHFAAGHFDTLPTRILLAAGAKVEDVWSKKTSTNYAIRPIAIAEGQGNTGVIDLLTKAISTRRRPVDFAKVKEELGLDLAKRNAAIRQERQQTSLNDAADQESLADKFEKAPKRFFGLHCVEYKGQVERPQTKDVHTHYLN